MPNPLDEFGQPGPWRSRLSALQGPGGIRGGLDVVQEASVRQEVQDLSQAELEEEFDHARVSGMSGMAQFQAARRLREVLRQEFQRRGLPRPQQATNTRGRYVAGSMPTPLEDGPNMTVKRNG